MKLLIFFLTMLTSTAYSQDFETDAKTLAGELKTSLMSNLSTKIKKDGVQAAIPFCHENVKPIAKEAAKNYLSKYEFGRASHKVRNSANQPQEWMQTYINDFVKIKFEKEKAGSYGRIGRLPNGKQVYVEPLFIQAQCLSCHGDHIAKNVSDKLSEIYPNDKATGFKLNEFRGIIWVKEK